ncbi:10343_t:CDS:2 [Funneliformis geosporum]|nr:10343_t:CDS:2 [Funneliformis geosporum]
MVIAMENQGKEDSLGVYVSHKGFCNEEKVKKPKIKKDEEPKIVMEEFPSEEEKEKKRIELEELEKKERAELEIEALVKDVMVDKKRSCHKCHVYD